MNAGYAQLMYEQWLRDPMSVDEEWRALFSNGQQGLEPEAPSDVSPSPVAGPPSPVTGPPSPVTGPPSPVTGPPSTVPIRGGALRLIANMTESLGVPTATSFRDVDVAALDLRRRELNAALAPRKVS